MHKKQWMTYPNKILISMIYWDLYDSTFSKAQLKNNVKLRENELNTLFRKYNVNLSPRDLKCENILLDQDNIVKVSGMFSVETIII